jgi:hypothetical protein
MAVKKATSGKAIVRWDAELSKLAQMATSVEENVGAGGNMIGTAGGRLKYKGADIPGNKMTVVVVDHVIEYGYYTDGFDPDNPQSPACFAFGRDEKQLCPHEKSADKQNDTCQGCPQNEFVTALVGKGKACKNIRRLAILSQGDLEDVVNAEIAYLKVPVTSVKGWAGYVRQIAEVLKRPPLGVLTEISLHPDPKTQFRMEFKMVETIDDGELIGALLEKKKSVEKEIEFPYVQIEQEERPQRRGGRPVPQRKAGKTKF